MKNSLYVKYEVFIVVKIWIVFFWVVTACRMAGDYKYVRGIHCLHLQGRSGGEGSTFLQNNGQYVPAYLYKLL
jgi:hypothetical protein